MAPGLLIRIILGLVVQEDTQNGGHHAQHIGAGHWVAQHNEGNSDDHDPLGGVGH